MTVSQLINEILTEWAFRVEDGMPNPKNPTHLKELDIVLSEMGLSHIKTQLIENLLLEKGKTPEKHVVEADKQFKNPILNKTVKYKNAKGEDAEGIVGNLLRLPKDHPGRKAAEALLPPEGSDERDAMNKDLGGENQPEKGEQPKDDKGGGEEQQPQEDPIKKAAQMYDPKLDPAMGVRLDKEKETLAQLAKDAEKQDKEAEKEVEPEKKEDGGFNPIPSADVQSEIPQADPETFNSPSDIPDGIEKEDLDKFNTDIQKVKQIVDDAKAKGEKAPNINLCQVTVPGTNLYCDDNLGIPRAEMPQFKGKPQPGTPAAEMPVDKDGEVDTEPLFKKMLKDKGITVTQTEVPADKLKATQSELVGPKVVGMMGALEENPNHPKITAPIYVSRDGYVIDGHHRWAAIAAYNAAHPDSQIPMKVQVIDQDIKDAIPMCNKFAEEQGVAAKKADANKEDVVEPKETEKLPEPEPADETPGGVIYSLGGGYYSDTPGGPAQYVATESVVEKVLIEGDESLTYLLFEAVVNKVTSRGKKVKVQTISPRKQKAATKAAKKSAAKTATPPAPSKKTAQPAQPVATPSGEKESGKQEIESPKTDAEKKQMRTFTDKSVTSSLELTKSDAKAQEKKAKEDWEKAVKAWEKGGKQGPKPQFTKGLGAGSPESRAGESAVVKGCLTLKAEYEKCIAKSKDREGCYLQAREKTRTKLESFLGSDSFLTDEWIDSAMNTLDLIHEEIGFDNIEEIGWDNQQGRALVGSQGHGTSADMFIKAKPSKEYPNGKRIGISLKKDLKVFVFNGGWAKLEKVVTDRGFKLGEKSTMEYYNKRRYEELASIRNFAETNNADFCKDFDHLKKNPNRISNKPQNVQSRVSDILKKTGKSDLSKVKCADFIESIINERPPSVDSMKIIGDLCKTSTNDVLKDAYKKLRALDREMTDGISNDFMKPENQSVVKKLVRDETHISDILFADNPNLDELKVVFGTEPAISMKPEKLAELFGITKLHQAYLQEKDPKKKAALKKKMEDIIDSKIIINNKKGVMSVAITINDKDGNESQLPLFEAKIRTRGFGNSPTFEMPQTVFGGLAYKYGNTNYSNWEDDDKEIVVSSSIKDIEDDFSEELEFLDDKTSAEIVKRLKDLETIYPNSPSLVKFKKKYLQSNNKAVQTAKQKVKTKKK